MPAQLEQVRAAGARLVLVQRLDQEVGRAGLERVVADPTVVDHGDHDDWHVDAVGEGANLLHELDTVELGELVVGQDHVDAIVARELQRATRGVEQLQVQFAVDLADDLREQEAAREQVVDDQDGVALGAGKRQLRDDAGRTRLRSDHDVLLTKEVVTGKSSKKHAPPMGGNRSAAELRARSAAAEPEWARGRASRAHRCGKRSAQCGGTNGPKLWSGREDSNFRPPAPHAGALPGCATPRHESRIISAIIGLGPAAA